LKDSIDVKSAVPASQGATYRGKTPISGVTLEVAVTNNGSGQILIVDQTKNKKWTKSLTGHIKYELDAAAKTLALIDFSATPTELGLGTLLLLELAMFAKEKAIALIVVPAPAATAMGAYEVFGGMPWNPKKQERDAKDYHQDFATVPAHHKSFVHQEAQELAEEKATRATFFDPPSGDAKEVKAKKDKIKTEAYEAHVSKHTGPQDYARAARLKALSGHLTYNSDALLQKTLGMFARKWTRLG
jgi:hypothetical protein